MASVKVSEKTLEILKRIKEAEQIKTIDGVIRYLFNTSSWFKIRLRITCPECGKYTVLSEKNPDGIFYKWYRCSCGHQIDLNPRGPFLIPENYEGYDQNLIGIRLNEYVLEDVD